MLFLKYLEHSLDTYHCGQLFNVYSCTCIIFLVDCTFVLYFCVIPIWSDGVFYNIGPTMDNVEYVNYYPVHLFSA